MFEKARKPGGIKPKISESLLLIGIVKFQAILPVTHVFLISLFPFLLFLIFSFICAILSTFIVKDHY